MEQRYIVGDFGAVMHIKISRKYISVRHWLRTPPGHVRTRDILRIYH